MADHTYAEGDIVRVQGWRNQVFRIVKFNLVAGEVDLWGGAPGRASMRTVLTARLLPAGPRDSLRASTSFPRALGRR